MKFIKEQGISLLEVLAALVILSLGATVTLSWFSQSMSTMKNIKDQENILLVQIDVIESLRGVNPVTQPEGEFKLKEYHIRWSSSVKKPMQTMRGNQGGIGLYEVGVFNVVVNIYSIENNIKLYSFNVDLPGYRKLQNSKEGIL